MKTQRRQQNQKQHGQQRSAEHGITAVRRRVSPDSHGVLRGILNELRPELHMSARLFDVRTLGVTVIGYSCFDKRHRGIGPRTSTITERVSSSRSPIEAMLGVLGMYGSEVKPKLAISLTSGELALEAENFEAEFESRGFPLKPDPNTAGEYVPHCSLALMYSDRAGHFEDFQTLSRLGRIAHLSSTATQTILLEPLLT